MIRRLLFVLVCLGLALHGVGARTLAAAPCPMDGTVQSMLAAGELDEADLPDCCNDAQTFATTGQLCKSGHDGSPSPTLGLAPTPGMEFTAAAAAAPRGVAEVLRPAPVSLPWRPPAGR